MTPTDWFMLKTAAGWLTGKMVATPIHAALMGMGLPWLSGIVLHGLAEALAQVL